MSANKSQKQKNQEYTVQQQIIIDDEYYKQNVSAFNLAMWQTGPCSSQVNFSIRLNIPRLNWGICRRLAIPFMGDEYYDVRICVNMWLWRPGQGNNLAPQPSQELIPLITCPIREIRLWRNGQMVYSCHEFRVGDDGFGGSGVVLGPGKLVSVMFEPISGIPLINRLRERYDDYVLDVEFKNQLEPDNEKMEDSKIEKPNTTLRTATAQLLTRVYSTDARREKFIA